MEDREVVSVEDNHATDQESRLLLNGSEELEALQSLSSSSEGKGDEDELDKLTSRAINALIVLGFGTFAVSKLLTIDHDYWHVRYLIFDSVLGLFTVFSFIIVI
jgi:protein Mpv17